MAIQFLIPTCRLTSKHHLRLHQILKSVSCAKNYSMVLSCSWSTYRPFTQMFQTPVVVRHVLRKASSGRTSELFCAILTIRERIEALAHQPSGVAVERSSCERTSSENTFGNPRALGSSNSSVSAARSTFLKRTVVTSKLIWMDVSEASQEDAPIEEMIQLKKGQALEELFHRTSLQAYPDHSSFASVRDQR